VRGDRAAAQVGSSAPAGKPLLTYSYEMIVSTRRGDIKESRRLLDQALEVDPNDYLVRARYMTRDYAAAEAAYRRSAALDGDRMLPILIDANETIEIPGSDRAAHGRIERKARLSP
jgi:tetratricopeptide (TPR) repeat protein